MTTDQIDREALKAKLKSKPQPWTAAKPEVRSAFAPIKAPVIAKPVTVPEPPAKSPEQKPAVKPVTAKPPSAPRPTITLAAAVVDVRLEVKSHPKSGGLGSVFPLRSKDGTRTVIVQLFSNRPIVEQALARNDTVVLRHVAAELFVEWCLRSGCSRSADIIELWKAMVIRLGGPFDFWTNTSFWCVTLAEHELSSKLDGLGDKAIPWFSIGDVPLPAPSQMWQWNPQLAKPEPKKKPITPEGEKK